MLGNELNIIMLIILLCSLYVTHSTNLVDRVPYREFLECEHRSSNV
jgi:hypothetical protein